MSLTKKMRSLSRTLRRKITKGERKYTPDPKTPITNWLVDRKRHCNGGRTVDAGLWLKKHCDNGGKIFLSLAGAASTFQQGIDISEMIKKGKIAAVSATGANLEESAYRLLANSHYAYIRDYNELTREEEKELDDVGFRRITDTFLPEDESVRKLLSKFIRLMREAMKTGKYLLWHEYFFELFERGWVKFDGDPEQCWLYQAWKHKVAVFVPGVEDSTMGNIAAYFTYSGDHKFLSKYKQKKPIDSKVILHSFSYMHRLAEWYMDNTKKKGLAYLQYGGGIAGDFAICVVPHLKKDYCANLPLNVQEKLVRSWAGFIEIHSSPMTFGSYSGAGFKEKITWSKFNVTAFGCQICGDYTEHGPDICAIVLGK